MKLHLSEQVCLCCRGNNVYKEIGDHEADDDDDDYDNNDDERFYPGNVPWRVRV